MNKISRLKRIALLPLVFLTGTLMAQDQGVIQDPDGYTNLRAGKSAQAAVVAKVPEGEVFEFQMDEADVENPTWLKISLKSGKSGYMHASRVRFYASKAELKEDGQGSEIDDYAKAHGFDYGALSRAAAQGESKSLEKFLGITDADGAAAESHCYIVRTVVHILGDDALAAFLKDRPLPYLQGVRDWVYHEAGTWPFEPYAYMKRAFPKTDKILGKLPVTPDPEA